MFHGRANKNCVIYTDEEFIASITQHIPEKSFQMMLYSGWYSNKKRGLRKHGFHSPGDKQQSLTVIFDTSQYLQEDEIADLQVQMKVISA